MNKHRNKPMKEESCSPCWAPVSPAQRLSSMTFLSTAPPPALCFRAVFSNLSPLMALLVSFLTLSITFVSRPIGAIVFGHYGDKDRPQKIAGSVADDYGYFDFFHRLNPQLQHHRQRRAADTYLFAPLPGLCHRRRKIGGATTLITEYAPRHRRGFFGTLFSWATCLACLSPPAFLRWW